MSVLWCEDDFQTTNAANEDRRRMKATLDLPLDGETLGKVLQDIQNSERSTVSQESTNKDVTFTVEAQDFTALRAALTNLLNMIAVYVKTNESS